MPSRSTAATQIQQEVSIGEGLTSEVFSSRRDHVLKLFLPWLPLATVQRGFEVTRAIQRLGLSVRAARDPPPQ